MATGDDLPTRVRRAGWQMDPAGGATYRLHGAKRSGQIESKAAPALDDRRRWHAAIRDVTGRVVLSTSVYGPIEAVEWVERHCLAQIADRGPR